MNNETIYNTFLDQGLNYDAYIALTDELLAQGKTTGPAQSEILTEYTRLNRVRMSRIEKTFKLLPALEEVLLQLGRPFMWGVLSEAWCGDAAQSVPVMAGIAANSPNISLKILLRDDYTNIMDCFLTNGGRSIPKLICFDAQTHELLFTWGPRPQQAQELVLTLKSDPEISKNEMVEQIQLWYARDKTKSIQLELADLLENVCR